MSPPCFQPLVLLVPRYLAAQSLKLPSPVLHNGSTSCCIFWSLMDLYRLALQGWMRSHSNSGSDSTMTLRAQLVLSMFSQFFDSDLTASRIPRVVQPLQPNIGTRSTRCSCRRSKVLPPHTHRSLCGDSSSALEVTHGKFLDPEIC